MTEFTQCQKDALDISHSVGVTASAGTGKTFLLQNRFVALLRDGAHPHEILCLTFTDKAAAEMQDKIEQELRRQSDAEIRKRMDGGMTREEAEENNLTRALASIHQCTISTFHGFCSGLLHEFPIEADVPVSYAIMDSLAVHDLINTTIADILHQPSDLLQGPVTTLFRFIGSEGKITKAVRIFLDKWQTYAPWFAQMQDRPDTVVSQWNTWKSAVAETLWQEVAQDGQLAAFNAIENTRSREKAQMTAEAYRRVCAASTPDEKRMALIAFAEQENPGGEKTYGDLAPHYESVRNTVGRVIPSTEIFAEDDPRFRCMVEVMQAFGTVTAYIASRIAERKADGGFLDFDDLIMHVERLLDTNESIRQELCRRYRYILVDEVQDNDPVLTKLVRVLAEDVKEKNKLFVVGDMKQAIYVFRGANPAGFQQLLTEFPQKPVELDVNYRTVPFLIDAINTVFSRIYAPGNPDGISYPNVSAKRETDVGSFTILHNPNPKTDPKEGHRLAAWIHDRITQQDLEVCDTVKDADGSFREVPRKATYRDIAILIRAKSALKHLLPALKQYHIPYHVYKGNGFYEEQEISDLMNVIRAAVFRDNEPALYGALMSPYFGISDEELAVALTAVTETKDGIYDPQDRKYADRLRVRLAKSGNPRISAALALLKEFRKASGRLPASAFVRKIVRDTGILSVYGALDDGVDKIRNIRKFLDTVTALETGKGYGIMDVIQTIETCIAESINDELGAAEPDTDVEDRVQIMTVHVSKGLEYKVVVLYHAGAFSRDTSNAALCHPSYGCGCRGLKIPGSSAFDLFAFLDYLITEAERPGEEAGERRLFYVGMTRPRDHLVITDAGKKPAASSFMSFFEPASEGVPAERIEVCGKYPPETEAEDASLAARRQEVLDALPVGLKIAGEDEETVKPELYRYGSCVHQLFEGREDKETILQRYGYGESDMAEFERIITAFRNHPFLKNVAKEWHELSFTNANGEIRRADMVVRYTDGTYRIIDFKTDDFRAIPDTRRQEYFAQLTEYSDCLSKIFHTGKPIPACFYATRDGLFIDLDDITTYKPQ